LLLLDNIGIPRWGRVTLWVVVLLLLVMHHD